MSTWALTTALLATDRKTSVTHHTEGESRHLISYSPFGFNVADTRRTLLGFNGQPYEASTGIYLLGHGYRAFNMTFQRFNSPDSYSPFGSGGINAYVYCAGDPINYADPSGHMLKRIIQPFKKLNPFRRGKTGRGKNLVPGDKLFPSTEEFPTLGNILERTKQSKNSNRAALASQSLPPRRAPDTSSIQPARTPNSTLKSSFSASAPDLSLFDPAPQASYLPTAPTLDLFDPVSQASYTASAPSLSVLEGRVRSEIIPSVPLPVPQASAPSLQSLANLETMLPNVPTHSLKMKRIRNKKSRTLAS